MFGGQGWPLVGPPVIFTPTCAACITSYVQNPFNFEPNILPSGPREICLGPKYNFQSFKSPFKWWKKEEEKKKKEEEEEGRRKRKRRRRRRRRNKSFCNDQENEPVQRVSIKVHH